MRAPTVKTLPPPPAGRKGWPWIPPRWGDRPVDGPRISVIMPSFDQGAYLEEALRSVLLQGYSQLELIVIDGASHDDSRRILERYAPFLSFWVSEPDRGQAHAINKGLARSTGEILGWLNSDDLLLPGSLRRIAAAFAEPSSPTVVTGLRKVIDDDGRPLRNWVRDLPQARYLRCYCCVAQETVYWRREVYERLGPLDESLHYALDYDYWLRMLDAGYELRLLPFYLGAFREHGASKSATQLDVYRRDLRHLYSRYGLGRNEEDVLSQLGESWCYRLALLEDLCESRAFDHAGLTLAFLRWLERPAITDRAVSWYRHYRVHRPRRTSVGPRWRAASRSLVETLRGAPIFDAHEPHLAPANPLGQPRLSGSEAAELDAADLVVDGLAVGEGWSWVEKTAALVYRWADNDAEIVVTRPSGQRRHLTLCFESGPSLDWHPFAVEVLDQDDRQVWRGKVAEKETVTLELPMASGAAYQVFRLRVPKTDQPASAEDPRVLSFRLTWLGWRDDGPLFDLPVALGRTVQVALDEDDIVPQDGVRELETGRSRQAIPRDGLFVGRGWLAPCREAGRVFRQAVACGELVISAASRSPAELELTAEELVGRPCELAIRAADGTLLAKEPLSGSAVLRFKIPLRVEETQVLRLELSAEGVTLPRWRVFRVAWV